MGADATPVCWCGELDAMAIGADYLECAACGTLRFGGSIDPAQYDEVGGDEVGFYGADYWRQRVPEVHGNPSLEERAKADLCERAPYQLQRVLEWCTPRGSLLELGCAPGALTYLMRQAGFDAVGLEMSPQVVSWIEQRFAVPVLRGPLERIEDDGRWSAIVAVDVLEHLPRPLATLRLCRDRMSDDGLLFLQTPCYRGEEETWEMLLPQEHLFLFRESSVKRLLSSAGFEVIETTPSLFPYDMWVTAARGSAPQRRQATRGLEPLVAALIELAAEHRQAQRELAGVERDRSARLETIEVLSGELEEVRADQAAKETLVGELSEELSTIESDRRAKDDLLAELSVEIEELRTDQQAKEELLARHAGQLAAVDADRRSKDEVIVRLSADCEALRVDQEAKQRLLEVVDRELAEVRRDQSAKEDLIQRLSRDLASREDDAERVERELDALGEELAARERELHGERARSAQLEAELRRTAWQRLRRWLTRRG